MSTVDEVKVALRHNPYKSRADHIQEAVLLLAQKIDDLTPKPDVKPKEYVDMSVEALLSNHPSAVDITGVRCRGIPVRVRITDEMIERGAKARYESMFGEHWVACQSKHTWIDSTKQMLEAALNGT